MSLLNRCQVACWNLMIKELKKESKSVILLLNTIKINQTNTKNNNNSITLSCICPHASK